MANPIERGELGTTSADDAILNAALDIRLAEMRDLLDKMTLPSAAEALHTLRDAFPDAPLNERVRALAHRVQ